MTDTESDERPLSIAEMADLTGFTADTLRWYEREGILPRVSRSAAGRRIYTPRERDLVQLLAALRATGMPTASMKSFVRLMGEGPATHGRRVALLQETREMLDRRRREIEDAESALDRKIAHYEQLIDAGLDCAGAPVPDSVRPLQASRR